MICAGCQHDPGRNLMCDRANRHATGARKHCPHYSPTKRLEVVRTLRRHALYELHHGNLNQYAALLDVAHQTAKGLRG